MPICQLDELKTWLINEPSRDKTCLQDFPTGPNTNRAVRPQNMAIGLKFRKLGSRRIVLYILCGYHTANLRRCFCVCKKQIFS